MSFVALIDPSFKYTCSLHDCKALQSIDELTNVRSGQKVLEMPITETLSTMNVTLHSFVIQLCKMFPLNYYKIKL